MVPSLRLYSFIRQTGISIDSDIVARFVYGIGAVSTGKNHNDLFYAPFSPEWFCFSEEEPDRFFREK